MHGHEIHIKQPLYSLFIFTHRLIHSWASSLVHCLSSSPFEVLLPYYLHSPGPILGKITAQHCRNCFSLSVSKVWNKLGEKKKDFMYSFPFSVPVCCMLIHSLRVVKVLSTLLDLLFFYKILFYLLNSNFGIALIMERKILFIQSTHVSPFMVKGMVTAYVSTATSSLVHKHFLSFPSDTDSTSSYCVHRLYNISVIFFGCF